LGDDIARAAAALDQLPLDHVGLVVPDLGPATEFYRSSLGCTISEPVVVEDHDIGVVFVGFANAKLELIAPLGRRASTRSLLGMHTAADFLGHNPQGGLHHVCLLTPDLAALLDRLRGLGVRTLGNGVPVRGASGRPIIFLDPETTGGGLIELKEAG